MARRGGAAEHRLDASEKRPGRAREEEEAERQRAEDEQPFDPQVRADVVLPDREQKPDRAEGDGGCSSYSALEQHRPRDRGPPPGMPTRRLHDADSVAAERRRKHLTRGVRDEVGAREPGHALVNVVRGEQPAPAQREDRNGKEHDRHRECEPREVRVRENVERRTELDLPEEVRNGRGGQDDRPDLPRLRVMQPVLPRTSRGDGTNLGG